MADAAKVIRGLEFCLKVACTASSGEKCPYIGSGGADGCIYEMQNDALKLLKERELGHWIFLTDCSNSGVYCSECNTKVFDSYPFKKKFSYFCPHCGTRMEGEIERR